MLIVILVFKKWSMSMTMRTRMMLNHITIPPSTVKTWPVT